MIELIYLITPIFLIILLGKILSIILITDDGIWNHINRLAYWVLFPCLLFNKTSVIDFKNFDFGALSITMIVGFSVAIIFSYVFGKMAGLSNPSITSVMQGGARHNAFIALAVISQLYGDQGAMVAAIIIAVLVTFTNIVVNVSLTVMLAPKGASKWNILHDLKRNPFIIAIVIGGIFNVMGWSNLPILHDFTLSVGQTTLTVALLCVGAGLQIKSIGDKITACVISCVAKMGIFPISVYLMAQYFELSQIMTMSAMIFAIAPTGAASYPLAKQMGGDAPLMATLISIQTLMSVVAIPFIILMLN